MSALGRILRESIHMQTVAGSLYGTGTLAIPAGTVSVTITGAGAPGGSDYVYYPGQPYIAAVPYHGMSGYNGSYYKWVNTDGGSSYLTGHWSATFVTPIAYPTGAGQTAAANAVIDCYWFSGLSSWIYYQLNSSGGTSQAVANDYVAASAGQPARAAGYYWSYNNPSTPIYPHEIQAPYQFDSRLGTPPTANGQTLSNVVLLRTPTGATFSTALVTSATFTGQATVVASAGQPYIAPSSTGGPYTGDSTTCTLNSVTKTWVGGYYTTAPVSATYDLVSDGSGQTLSYAVPAGGTLDYSFLT